MALDVEKIRTRAADIAGRAAQVANDAAAQLGPAVRKVDTKVDELVDKGRPVVADVGQKVSDMKRDVAEDAMRDDGETGECSVAEKPAADLAGGARAYLDEAGEPAQRAFEEAKNRSEIQGGHDIDGDGFVGAPPPTESTLPSEQVLEQHGV